MNRGMCLVGVSVLLLLIGSAGGTRLRAQAGMANGEWRSHSADTGSTKYSSLDQINRENAGKLGVVWRFKTDSLGPSRDSNWQATPLMVGRALYMPAGSRRDVVSVDAVTGELLWMYRLDEGARDKGAPWRGSGRSVAYWTDRKGDERIFHITLGYHLVALDAKTGRPIAGFGDNGVVDLKTGLDRRVDPLDPIGTDSGPLVANDVVVVGAAADDGSLPRSRNSPPGFIRGYDVRTGKRLWIFHTIPVPGEPGNETWLKDSWSYTGHTGAWTLMTADEELGRVYIPVESATGDYYGGHRPGSNLYANSLVCLDIRTGKLLWHFQFTHHDLWDFDLPAPPVLVDVTVGGRRIKAVAQVTKQSWVYVFDRVTGQPLWPIVERPVPKGNVPGEWYSPTQPFPTKPAPFDRQGLSADDLIDFTPELKAEALKIISQYVTGPLFTPPVLRQDPGAPGKKGFIELPSSSGGANWPGAGVDVETGILYVPSKTEPSYEIALEHDARSDLDYVRRGNNIAGPQGLPLVKPPWGRITAIDLNTGEHVWMVPNGDTPDNVRNHPALKGVQLPERTGRVGRVGVLVTKTLLFAGQGGPPVATPTGPGSIFRAYDKRTGQVVAEVPLPANTTGPPMTYMVGGRQYIAVAVGGNGASSELVSLALP